MWNDFDYVTIGVFCYKYDWDDSDYVTVIDFASLTKLMINPDYYSITFAKSDFINIHMIILSVSSVIISSSYKRSFEKDPTYFFGSWLLIPYKMKSTKKKKLDRDFIWMKWIKSELGFRFCFEKNPQKIVNQLSDLNPFPKK